jgi:two-component system, response regulator PdtaR
MLKEASFHQSGEAKNIPEFLRILRLNQPWLAVIDTGMPPGNIRQLASIIEEDGLSAALYLETGKAALNGYMVLHWPVEAPVLTAVAETLCLEYARKRTLKKRIKGLEEKLIMRKEIERAKGFVMLSLSLNEEMAYRYLQKRSMECRQSMLETACQIINEHDLASS